MIILQETYDLLTKFEECRSEADVSRLTLKLAGEFGVEHFLSGTMPSFNETPEEQIAHIISGSWPDEWGERYFNIAQKIEGEDVLAVQAFFDHRTLTQLQEMRGDALATLPALIQNSG